MEINELYLGHCLDILKTFPDECIDMVMTSPPYWGLRNYHNEPVIWEKDSQCDHKWQEVNNETFCEKCGAWRGTLGNEPNFRLYVEHLCLIFDEIRRVLKKQGTCFVNIGDTYSGSYNGGGTQTKGKNRMNGEQDCIKYGGAHAGKDSVLSDKCLCNIPNRFAIQMTERGWIQRNEIIWYKPNQLPQSAQDRFTVDFEKILFFVKEKNYYFEMQYEPYIKPLNRWGGEIMKRTEASYWDKSTGQQWFRDRKIRPNEKGRQKRSVWSINTRFSNCKGEHFASYPVDLCVIPILAGCPEGGIILDPFIGTGTTAIVAKQLKRMYIGIDANESYLKRARIRISQYSIQDELFGTK